MGRTQALPRLVDDPDLALHSVHAEALAMELRALLERLVADTRTFLIVDVGDRGRFVQVITCDGTRLHAESVGDAFVGEAAPLDDAERDELARLGWEPPDRDGCVNWSVGWDPPDLDDAAQLLALTLSRVHHLTDPADALLTAGEAWGCGPEEGR